VLIPRAWRRNGWNISKAAAGGWIAGIAGCDLAEEPRERSVQPASKRAEIPSFRRPRSSDVGVELFRPTGRGTNAPVDFSALEMAMPGAPVRARCSAAARSIHAAVWDRKRDCIGHCDCRMKWRPPHVEIFCLL
jgi:hypothetical protein